MLKSFRLDGRTFTVEVQKQGTGFFTGITEGGPDSAQTAQESSLAIPVFQLTSADTFEGEVAGRKFRGEFQYVNGTYFVHLDGRTFRFEETAAGGDDAAGSGIHRSAMPGKVISVECAQGDEVEEGQTLLVVEAMKMENAIKADGKGKVAAVNCKVGDLIQPEDVLVEIT